ncbi:MAG: RnfH family protein [Azoarcus sp.]|jgi:putative ubiquitin-RnfH superfamily antitoxin RatB of RatAB toxin-antitoxin module|nr:RnfH family protein [Azoarcus sp.]
MRIGVAYSDGVRQTWLRIDVPDNVNVMEAIERSGVLGMFPSIDLDAQKVGIFGKVVKLDAPLKAGDRVEIYRPITCDPTQVPRRNGMEGDE